MIETSVRDSRIDHQDLTRQRRKGTSEIVDSPRRHRLHFYPDIGSILLDIRI
jgi:hypothetical protein